MQNAWPPNLLFEKLSERKKSFEVLKLRENSHEIMVDKLDKSRAALQFTARELMIPFFFKKTSTVLGYAQLPEIVARRSGNLQIMPGVRRNLFSWLPMAIGKKVWGPLIYSLACLSFYSTVWPV